MKNKIQWSGYEWDTSPDWGLYHPNDKVAWYDEKRIKVDESGELTLSTEYNPRYGRQIGVGMILSNFNNFSYGEYEITAKLPRGSHLFPAFWILPIGEAPPEIDIFEAATKRRRGYFRWNPFRPWDVKSNAHYGKNYEDDHREIGAKHKFFGYKNPSKNYISYKMLWMPGVIEIYYNNKIVRKIENQDLLDQINGKNIQVIINNMATDKTTNYNQVSKFKIKSFKYTPLSKLFS